MKGMPSTDDSETTDAGESSFVTTFDPAAGDRPSEAVVTAVAAVDGERPLELDPLYDAIDPDALNTLFEHARRVGDSTQRLRFPYAGFDVSVRSDGRIRITGVPATGRGIDAE